MNQKKRKVVVKFMLSAPVVIFAQKVSYSSIFWYFTQFFFPKQMCVIVNIDVHFHPSGSKIKMLLQFCPQQTQQAICPPAPDMPSCLTPTLFFVFAFIQIFVIFLYTVYRWVDICTSAINLLHIRKLDLSQVANIKLLWTVIHVIYIYR